MQVLETSGLVVAVKAPVFCVSDFGGGGSVRAFELSTSRSCDMLQLSHFQCHVLGGECGLRQLSSGMATLLSFGCLGLKRQRRMQTWQDHLLPATSGDVLGTPASKVTR